MRYLDDWQPSGPKRATLYRRPGWTIKDLAEAKGVSKHSVIRMARDSPLPEPLFTAVKGGNKQKFYTKPDLENWYAAASKKCQSAPPQ